MNNPILILILAFGLDQVLGDPVYPWHPVRLIGRLITVTERFFRKRFDDMRVASLGLPLATAIISIGVYYFIRSFLGSLSWFLDLYLVYSLLALKDLHVHGKKVADALSIDALDKARNHVQMMVGRNTEKLNAHGIARAAIESLAENFVDGFLSPLFWYALAAALTGSPSEAVAALIGFKVISTLDSMVGYKNETYKQLGAISAKLDDVLNFVPARLSIPLISLAAKMTHLENTNAWRIGWRDRLNHDSPNSAHAEAAIAGALDLKLGGPSEYHGKLKDKPWIGEGRTEATDEDINRGSHLLLYCGYIATGIALTLLFFSPY